ncbi:glycosyltransferase family 4 protein [Levilactobacillus acidifarinae]|uniref:Cps1B protein n=1 Tax=Levilactobacillus acidifarinae DSM 19394 = JCM 15949 TaxID=1423715 RepID=A0A0R1LHF7_9LACO|nr:glycosyltransferase family 4 protein [Levilactobacillus acidifarinae]KRK95125.1 cps1B protein [Levilactobacillus acidifarinae DSM 19394]GEO70624.1 glycosyltransferase family 1 (GT1) [Levilactobacillus acidifarinae]
MKITFVLPGFSRFPVGGFQIVYEYANYLVKHKHDVEIIHAMFLPTQSAPSFKNYMKYQVKRVSLGLGLIKPWFRLDSRVKVRNIGKIKYIDVRAGDRIIATAWETAEFVNMLPKTCGEKYYFIQHYEIWGGKERVDKTWKLPLHKIVIASWLKSIAQGFDESAILVPNFVEHNNFYLTKPIETRDPIISMLYSEHAIKGSHDGIEALNMVKKDYPNVKIKLFGVYEQPENLPEGTEYYRTPSREILRNQIYNESLIYLFPSVTEGWGLTATEAMACGAALVSTENGGVDDFGINRETALVSPIKDPRALYENIRLLLDNDDLRQEIARKGQSVVSKLTLEHSGLLFEKALKQDM